CSFDQPDQPRLGGGIRSLPHGALEPRIRANHDDRPCTLCKQWDSHGAEAMKSASKVRLDDLCPFVFRMTDDESTCGEARLAYKRGRWGPVPALVVNHLRKGLFLSDSRLIELSPTTSARRGSRPHFSTNLIAVIVYPPIPAS